ncbi:hypothetical protein G4B84_009048, partial [Aspergillus flavus NRRL3357]
MASSIANKVFIVMGSASGMGLATATTLLAKGAFPGLCDINQDGLSKFIQSLNEPQRNKVITQVVDITNRAAVASFLHSTKKKFGRIDGIARFAGTASHRLGHQEIYEIDETEYNFVMDINEPGSIVHAASMYFERGFAKGSVYSASKHASIGGPIHTPMLRANVDSGGEGTAPDVPLGRLGMASEVADVVALLLSDEARPLGEFQCSLGHVHIYSLMHDFETLALESYSNNSPNQDHLLSLPKFNIQCAIIENTIAMGMTMEWMNDDDAVSIFNMQGPGILEALIPASLRPTIDEIDDEELCHDLMAFWDTRNAGAMLLVWGPSWVPGNWEMTPAFVKKWGYLLGG